ncbi:hypothetical protein ACJX0J_032001 [Zea mays]
MAFQMSPFALMSWFTRKHLCLCYSVLFVRYFPFVKQVEYESAREKDAREMEYWEAKYWKLLVFYIPGNNNNHFVILLIIYHFVSISNHTPDINQIQALSKGR